MSEMVLRTQWFNHFSNKITEEFGFDVSSINNYQPDVSPLVYCCLHNRRIINRKRKIIYSNAFLDSDWVEDERWVKLKCVIENGTDINSYMSKSLSDWMAVDYLLYCYNITHFHLYKNKSGGIRKELVFGVFTSDSFYLLCIGDHNDIYKPDELLSQAYNSWPEEIFNYSANFESHDKFCQDFFKKQANIPALQFNNFNSVPIKSNEGKLIATVDNGRHTILINFTLNEIEYRSIPFRAYCAYVNEVNHIEEIEMSLVRSVNANKMDLLVLPEQKKYIVKVHNRVPFTKSFSFRKKAVLCSLYNQ